MGQLARGGGEGGERALRGEGGCGVLAGMVGTGVEGVWGKGCVRVHDFARR